MANIKTRTDDNRLKANLYQPQIDTVIPEHFHEQYPDLVKFLEAYYEYLDSDGQPTNKLKNIFYAKEPGETDSDNLALLFEERAPGLAVDTFPAPSFSYKLLPGLYRVKGSNTSVDGFFRYFFQESVERILPRNSMFIVGESEIGDQSEKFIQDSYFYQIYSILLKSGIPAAQYSYYYKNYLHPSGFAIFYQTSFEEIATLGFRPSTEIIELNVGEFAASTLVEGISTASLGGIGSLTHTDSSLDRRFYSDKAFNFYDEYRKAYYEKSDGILADSPYNGQYISVADLLDPNSPRWSSDIDSSEFRFNMSDSDTARGDFSDSVDSGTFDTVSPFPGIKFSNTIETFDEDQFQFYDNYEYPDSAHMLADSVPV
jgi:hypothetical protein